MKDRMMKEMMLPGVALAALCLSACDRNDRADRTDANDVVEQVEQVEKQVETVAKDHEVAPHGAHDPAASHDSPSTAASSPGLEPSSGVVAKKMEETRAEYVAASRRRLDDMESELQQLEARSRERGKELRGEIRQEKRRLEAQVRQVRKEIDPAA